MRAMILAAGRGERMRPLTDTTPKPLLSAGGKPLIVWHIERLARAGITDIIVNHAWLGTKIERALGDGSRFGVALRYSPEPQPLETAGGIRRALPFFVGEPFLVINGDIWTDWDPRHARQHAAALRDTDDFAWLLLVDNPPQHPDGDFILEAGRVSDAATGASASALTFAGVGVYRPALFEALSEGAPARLAPLLREAMAADRVAGTRHAGEWVDVGTPQRLAQLDARLRDAARNIPIRNGGVDP